MILAVLLSFDCHLLSHYLIKLTRKHVLIGKVPYKTVYSMLNMIKSGTNSSVGILFPLIRALVLRNIGSFENPRRQKVFRLTDDPFRLEIHSIMTNTPKLTYARRHISPNNLRREGVKQDYQLKRFILAGIKDRGLLKRDKTVHTYVLEKNTGAVQLSRSANTRNILRDLNKNIGKFFNFDAVELGWEVPFTEESHQLFPQLL